jgi:hypothetical protein
MLGRRKAVENRIRNYASKKKPSRLGWVAIRKVVKNGLRNFGDIAGLRTLLALDDFKLYLIAFLQAFVAFAADRAIVNEYIRPVVATDKAEAFSIVEPLDHSSDTSHFSHLLAPLLNPASWGIRTICRHDYYDSRQGKYRWFAMQVGLRW